MDDIDISIKVKSSKCDHKYKIDRVNDKWIIQEKTYKGVTFKPITKVSTLFFINSFFFGLKIGAFITKLFNKKGKKDENQ